MERIAQEREKEKAEKNKEKEAATKKGAHAGPAAQTGREVA